MRAFLYSFFGDVGEAVISNYSRYHREENMGEAVLAERIKSETEVLTKARVPFEMQGKLFRITTQFGAVIYCPKQGHWQHRGRKEHGDAVALVEWLRARELLA